MAEQDQSKPTESEKAKDLTRRSFLQYGVAAAAAAATAGVMTFKEGSQPEASETAASSKPIQRPNFLILMCDEMRFPPVYESQQLKAFRKQYLRTQNFLRLNGADFQRHYSPTVACVPCRASIYTGHYPSLHGATQTTGAAKQAFDPDVFWLDPNSVPTLGDYFRTAGYQTYWRGKWHIADADMLIPGTHNQLLSYNAMSGAPDPSLENLYQAADRLDRFGFTGWIGPEPHGSAPLNSGSSVPPGEKGRDIGFGQQAQKLLQQLNSSPSNKPWFVVSSFVNPHDITLWGLWANLGGGFEFDIQPGVVPTQLFDPVLFHKTVNDNLATKPSAQESYQTSYAKWLQPILNDPVTLERYYQYYYQLHKNVDDQMWGVLQTLLGTRFKNNTIVIFLSDHGDLLGSHHGMHQKWYTAYEEAIRVPLIIWNKQLFPKPVQINNLTSHVDLLPTLLGLADIPQEDAREILARNHSDARPLVGRDLSPLLLGRLNPSAVNDPLYFMTDDDPSRGLNQQNWTGIAYNSVIQPNHIETVIARLANSLGVQKVWKYSRYFDNPQFWSTAGYPNDPTDPNYPNVEDVTSIQTVPTPTTDGTYTLPTHVTVKHTALPDEFEMYNVTDDPLELNNLYRTSNPLPEQALLAALLEEQCAQKRLTPCSGVVPGQPNCDQAGCS